MSVGAPELLLDSQASVALAPETIGAGSPLQLVLARFRADRVAIVSAGFIVLLIVVAVAAPLIVDIAGVSGPGVQNPNALNAFRDPTGPSGAHPFGVDRLGRDVLARVIYGTRASLEVGIAGTAIAAAIGTVVGLLAGFYGGWKDTLLMRAVDVLLAFPVLVLGLGLGAACGEGGCVGGLIEPGAGTLIFIIAISSFPYVARIVRGQVLSLCEQEFIAASRALGASTWRTLLHAVLPNLLTPLAAYSCLLAGQSILLAAALSFLGVGIRPPSASWGQMISDAVPILSSAWWLLVFPGIALLLTALAFNLAGDGLLDALRPGARRR